MSGRWKRSDQDSKGPLGFNAYRMRSAEAIGKHWCLVFVAYSLLHLTCLPAVPDRTKGLIQTIGDASWNVASTTHLIQSIRVYFDL